MEREMRLGKIKRDIEDEKYRIANIERLKIVDA